MKHKLTTLMGAALLAAITLNAGTVKLGWDASVTPDVEYHVYASTNLITETNMATSLGILNVGTNLTAEFRNLDAGIWYFGATARKGGLESDLSNIISGEVPSSPTGAQIIPLTTVTNNGGNIFFLMGNP